MYIHTIKRIILTYVIHDSAHELCPVAFCVSILDRVGKCLTRETSDRRETKKTLKCWYNEESD